MAAPDSVNLAALIDGAKCFALARQHRWPEGVRGPGGGSDAVVRHGRDAVVRHGRDDTQPRRYRCKACADRSDDLTGTVLAGHHQPLRVWVLRLYLMRLNLSNRQIAEELGLSGSDAQLMTERLRHGLAAGTPAATLEGEVEIGEVYVVAGHKGQPAAVAEGGGSGGVAGWRERRAAARWRRTSRRSSA
jgi:transposase-like protein